MANFNIKVSCITRHDEVASVYLDSLRSQRDKLLSALSSYSYKVPSYSSTDNERDNCNDILEMIQDIAESIQDINRTIEDVELDIREEI
jgi:hypothetical protein